MITKKIVLYTPRYPQNKIHPQIEKHRFNVLVAHRRLGKSVLAVNHIIKMALMNNNWQPHYAFIAPLLKQAKIIAWDYLKYYTRELPGVKVNESELTIEFLGRRIYLYGADNPDSIRGPYWDGVVFDEYAQIKPNVWSEIVYPSLTDRHGWVLFCGTPKGMNQFYEIYNKAKAEMEKGNPDWWCGLYRADETNVLSQEDLELTKSVMSMNTFRQEYLCDWTASEDNTLITIDLVMEATKRVKLPQDIANMPKVIGVDVSRFGGDQSVIVKRQGSLCYPPRAYTNVDNMQLAGIIIREITDFKPDAVFIDSGRGEGVIDRLRQLGYDVIEVNFGGAATDSNHYANKRAEMWDKARQWLETGGALPNDSDLKTDLVTPTYKFDAQNRLQLESKDDIRKRMGRSPDRGDAFCLTFAYPVKTRIETIEEKFIAEMSTQKQEKYDPFRDFNTAYGNTEKRYDNLKGEYDPFATLYSAMITHSLMR